MGYMPMGNYIQGDSVLHHMGAVAKFCCFLLLLTAVVLTDTVAGYVGMLAIVVSFIKIARLPLAQVMRPIIRLWSFFLIILFMNTVFFETQEVLWSWWIFHVSWAGMIQGANVVLRVVLVMGLSSVLMATTTAIELTGAAASLLKPLKWIGVPTDDVAMILGVAIQFIPTLMEETDIIRKAQIARGARFESQRFCDRAASVIPLVIPIFLSAFRRADELATAMEARGYRRAGKRTKWQKAAIQLQDMAALAVSFMICTAQIIL